MKRSDLAIHVGSQVTVCYQDAKKNVRNMTGLFINNGSGFVVQESPHKALHFPYESVKFVDNQRAPIKVVI